ncbi:hypothetical protein PR003_g10591 [Phytophthora rubi]|uniref:Uncharacterized protein n=1 Tax=Phytophthora rubi TaxID=129364 RepID=A0A6A4F598_9STRA|nr:hypothetical protein PR003_g10591 [Phytophthora rubi]
MDDRWRRVGIGSTTRSHTDEILAATSRAKLAWVWNERWGNEDRATESALDGQSTLGAERRLKRAGL